MSTNDYPTDPNAETVGIPSDQSGKGSVPEPGKFATTDMPSEVGRYKILGIIASGGMGVVYEAMQEAPRRRVALKVIKAGAASEMALHRFQFEAQTLAKLSHPNIAQIYEAGTWESDAGEVPFFAMEYVTGARTVISHVQKVNLSIEARLELFSKICDAVHHGHQKGIIHRDLKPDNILIDSNGEPKIIDFGVARATDADLAVTTMQTTMGQLVGTLQYMSPEQCDADPDRIDTRSDVYALGVILFQLLSGKLPYDLRRQAIHEAVRIIKEQRPDSLGTVSGILKGDIDTIALKALEKDRERRYQSAAELANDIQHYLHNEPIIARPLSISYQLRLFTKKYKRTCVAVCLLAVSIILGLIGTTYGMTEANRQKIIAQEQQAIAESRYESILDMSGEFIGDFYAGVVKLNAAMEVRKLVLDSTLRHVTNLQRTAGDTPEIREQLANTHRYYGAYYAGLSAANIGDIKSAKNHYDISLQLLRGLVDEGYSKNNYSIAVVLYRVANLHRAEKEYSKSLSMLNDAKEIIVAFRLENPNHAESGRLNSAIDMSTVDTLAKIDVDLAIEALDGLVVKRRADADALPTDLRLRRDLANMLQRAGDTNAKKEMFDEAIMHFEEANSIYTTLVEAEPENGRAPRDLAWSMYHLGVVLISAQKTQEGLDTLEQGLTFIRDRYVAYPTDSQARDDIENYLVQYIAICKGEDQIGRANATCKEILLALQPVIEANPDNYALAEVFSRVEQYLGELKITAVSE